jgi:hypothetical protein
MPPSETNRQTEPGNRSFQGSTARLLPLIFSSFWRIGRFGKWFGIALALTSAMGMAASHLLRGGSADSAGKDSAGTASGGASSWSDRGTVWWQSSGHSSGTASPDSGSSSGSGDSSDGHSVVPVDRHEGFFPGNPSLKGDSPVVPIGSNSSSREAYAVLGLGASSTPTQGAFQGNERNGTQNGSGEIHFNLSGHLESTPILGISESSLTLAGIPEPGACGMLALGVAMLAMKRRRGTAPGV